MNEPKKVFVVVGQTGEYSDRNDWYVCAYYDQKLAERHADHASKWGKLHESSIRNAGLLDQLKLLTSNPYDKNMQMQYTGTDYYSFGVELRDELPKDPDEQPSS